MTVKELMLLTRQAEDEAQKLGEIQKQETAAQERGINSRYWMAIGRRDAFLRIAQEICDHQNAEYIDGPYGSDESFRQCLDCGKMD